MYCPNPECCDAERSGAASEYADGITVCPECGAVLVPSLPAWTAAAIATASESDPLVPCFTAADISLLPHIRARLESEGVAHLVKHEGVQHLFGWGTAFLGFNPVTGPPVVMVAASQVERVKALLADFSRADAASSASPAGAEHEPRGAPSTCGHCGGALEADDGEPSPASCYHCGWPL